MVLDQWCCILSNKYKDGIEKKEYWFYMQEWNILDKTIWKLVQSVK